MVGAVDIWSVDLGACVISPPISCLSHDENAFSDRLRGREHRDRWIRSRRALRTIIAAQSGQQPADVRFEHGPFGKPRLAAPGRNTQPVHFNLTRSGDLCLIATCRDHPVGIDVELTGAHGGEDSIARQFFAPREAATIGGLTGARKHRAFLDIWTRKEAYTKAIGVGLQQPLRDLDLSAVDARVKDAAAWRLVSLPLAAGYVGTVAIHETVAARCATVPIRTFDYSQFISVLHSHEYAQ